MTNFKGGKIQCQVSPIFEYGSSMSVSKYELSFVANVPALGLVAYTIHAVSESSAFP